MQHSTEPLPKALEEIRAELPAEPPDTLSPTTLDGNGVGYPLIATAAFRLFGFQWWAPIAVMLMLMAVSAAAFLRCSPPLLVTLYFNGLTVMLFTALVYDPGIRGQIPVGGVRYFSLVGLLPLFCILRLLMARQATGASVPLVIQASILTIAALTRGTAVTAFGAIALAAIVFVRSRELVTVVATGSAVVIAFALVVSPQWLSEGRFGTIVWTRMLEGLGSNPNLSIAELNRMYQCQKHVPGGIPPGIGDQGAGCIWFAHVIEHDIPIDSIWDKSFGGEFEATMRQAFFRIAFKYPWETLQTFMYYKPMRTIHSIAKSFHFNFSRYPPLSIALLLASLGIAFFAAATAVELGRETAVVFITGLFTATAYLVAYANPGTTGDLQLCCLMVPSLAFGAMFKGIVRLTIGRRRVVAGQMIEQQT